MTEKEFAAWRAMTESSTNHWTEDEIFRLNDRGAMYYLGGKKFLADMFSGHQEEANEASRRAYDQTEELPTEEKTPEVKQISASDLRTLPIHEGLVIQGCGGDLEEWVDGINETLTDEGILLDGAKFTDVYTFEHDGLTNMLFSMDDVKLDVGKMAMWRLQSHGIFLSKNIAIIH